MGGAALHIQVNTEPALYWYLHINIRCYMIIIVRVKKSVNAEKYIPSAPLHRSVSQQQIEMSVALMVVLVVPSSIS